MLNRRLLILFVAFFLGFIGLGLRLARLQLIDAAQWRGKMEQYVHRSSVVDSYRGSIVDRNGLVMAQDVPSDELAIDYRAMNLDDAWLKKKAIERLRAGGEWGHFANNAVRDRRLLATKQEIADQVEGIPYAIAAVLAPSEHIPPGEMYERILQRYDAIRRRVHDIKQDIWIHKFDPKGTGEATVSSSGETDVDDATLEAQFKQLQVEDEVASHTICADIPQSVATLFRQHLEEFPGLSVRDKAQRNRREYPFGESTVHLVGTLRSLSAESYAKNKFNMPDLLTAGDVGRLGGYLPGDREGETGLEKAAEEQLRGVRGVKLLDLSSTENRSHEDPRDVAPLPGKTVKLTIDAALQRDIYESLRDPAKALSKNMLGEEKDLLRGEDGKEHFAAMVVMALDGQVLALISYPSYDPNTLDKTRAALNDDNWRRPLVNRATSAIYHPGSTVKPLLAAAALTEHVITPEEVIHCSGHFFPSRPDIFKCDAVHDDVSLVRAITVSCDVYFYTVGDRMGMDRLVNWYGKYGFGRDTGMELPEARGNLPRESARDPEQVKNDAIFMGIGQGPMDVTPLQMANAYATLLRRGSAVPPRIMADSPAPVTQVFELSAAHLALIKQGMEQVTTSSEGTAKDVFRHFRLKVAGKTGTAETERVVYDDQGKPVEDPARPRTASDGTPLLKADGTPVYRQLVERHDDAWFVGYAPAEAPRYIVAAVMEWGGHGGAHAAPMVREAFMQLQKHDYLPHTDVP